MRELVGWLGLMECRLDALVNNAGIGSFPEGTSMKEQLTQAFLTNATGVQIVTDAFHPLLAKSTGTKPHLRSP